MISTFFISSKCVLITHCNKSYCSSRRNVSESLEITLIEKSFLFYYKKKLNQMAPADQWHRYQNGVCSYKGYDSVKQLNHFVPDQRRRCFNFVSGHYPICISIHVIAEWIEIALGVQEKMQKTKDRYHPPRILVIIWTTLRKIRSITLEIQLQANKAI